MAALRDLVVGSGCSTSSDIPTRNPLASLVNSLLLKGEAKVSNAGFSPVSTFPSEVQVSKVRNRTAVVTRHMFPGTFLGLRACVVEGLMISALSLQSAHGTRGKDQKSAFVRDLSVPSTARSSRCYGKPQHSIMSSIPFKYAMYFAAFVVQ